MKVCDKCREQASITLNIRDGEEIYDLCRKHEKEFRDWMASEDFSDKIQSLKETWDKIPSSEKNQPKKKAGRGNADQLQQKG